MSIIDTKINRIQAMHRPQVRSDIEDPGADETAIQLYDLRTEMVQDDCTICFSSLLPPVANLTCGHQFHDECWNGWVATKARTTAVQNLIVTCPLCRDPQTVSRPPDIPLPADEMNRTDLTCLMRCFEISLISTASIFLGVMYGFFRCATSPGYFNSCLQDHPFLPLEAIGVTCLAGILGICCLLNCCDY